MRDGTVERDWPCAGGHGGDADDAPVAPLPYTQLVDYIERNLARRIAVEELARIARLSVFQLSRAFRRNHATTPYGLVLAIRVRHAKRCLDAGATIAEAAQRAGFADQSHLTRHFKRIAGVTPKGYHAAARRVSPAPADAAAAG